MRNWLFVLAFVVPLAGQAAEITRIASSFDPDHPFGAFFDIGFERTQLREKLTRELHQDNTVEDVNELFYQMVDQRLKIDAHIGLWQDLEFYFGMPIVFTQDRTWDFVGQTNPSNSTIINNCVQANGQISPGCPGTPGSNLPMFNVPAASYRGGIGDLTFGLHYAFFNTKRDDTKPMWIVGFDYTAPTAATLDPTQPTSPTNRGNIGERVHRYQFWTALSKRIGIADPYFKLHYTYPYLGPGYYSNCDNPSPTNMGSPQNCGANFNGNTVWSRPETGEQPPHVGGIIIGSEFNAYDEPSKHARVAIDLRGIATYVSEGRYYNEMSDLFGKLMYTQEYLQVGGQFGLYAHPVEYVGLDLTASILYNTEHTVTYESIGKDLDGDGTVDITKTPQEVNPNFDYRVDMTSRRFRTAETAIFTINATATFSF